MATPSSPNHLLADVMNISTKLCSQRKQRHPEGLESPDCGCIHPWSEEVCSLHLGACLYILGTMDRSSCWLESYFKGILRPVFTCCSLVMDVHLSGTLYVQFLFCSEFCLAVCLQLIVLIIRLSVSCAANHPRSPPPVWESVEGKEHILFSTYHGEWHIMYT